MCLAIQPRDFSRLKRKSLQDILRESPEAQRAFEKSLFHAALGKKQSAMQLTVCPKLSAGKELRNLQNLLEKRVFSVHSLHSNVFICVFLTVISMHILLHINDRRLPNCSDLGFLDRYYYRLPCSTSAISTLEDKTLVLINISLYPFYAFWDFIHPQPTSLWYLHGSSHNLMVDLANKWLRR